MAPTSALADTTLGTTSPPAGFTPTLCNGAPPGGAILAQTSTAPGGPSYTVPAGGGEITSWQVSTIGATAPSPVSFVVMRPAGSDYTVVGIDNETITSTGGVQTFSLSSPIQVQGGDVLGLYLNGSERLECYYVDGSGPTADVASLFESGGVPAPGQTLPATQVFPGPALVNVAANLAPGIQDAAVTTGVGPSGASSGQDALLSSTVTNNGPGVAPVTFTDSVPTGLTIDYAGAGDGACSTSGQTVTCTISGLAAGQSAPVDIVVTSSAPGSYTNKVSVAPAAGFTDPNPANNSASATLNVGLSLPAKCVVPNLKGIALGQARTLLRDLGCKVKVSHAHSKAIKKGSVVKTKPGKGSYAYQRTVTLVISSGPKKKKHHKK